MLFPNDEILTNINGEKEYKRLTAKYENKSAKFMFQSQNDYSKQFAHIYASRLGQMRPLLAKKAAEKWGDQIPQKKMFELREDNPEKCIIIGTLFKHQQLKPSILRDISEELQLQPQPQLSNFADDSDKLILEDELQRIRISGKIDVHKVVTGIVVAVLGYEEGDGKLIVEDYLFYESGPQRPLKDLTDSPLLVLVSGLDQSSNNDFSTSLELFEQWIYGNIAGFGHSRDWEAASIVRIILAGNSVRSSHEKKERSVLTRAPESTETLKAVTSVDKIISNWIRSVNVDLMSGEFDPSNYMLPQQPMHPCLFPKCSESTNFHAVTNPYEFELADRHIIGTSGQNIQDILKFSKLENSLDVLRLCLIWSHISPTSPDTLPCFPYFDKDPFILSECPHVFFAGNTEDFKTELYTAPNGSKTRLVCVPSFSKTQSVVIVNLRTLDCNLLDFKVNVFDDMENFGEAMEE